jgi:hypothetical protein
VAQDGALAAIDAAPVGPAVTNAFRHIQHLRT